MIELTPAEARAAWVADLRSGRFDQTTSQLKNTSGHCCLGVACETFHRLTGRGEWIRGRFEVDGYGSTIALPPAVQAWLGLSSTEGTVAGNYPVAGADNESLISLNDDGYTFTEIADIIETDEGLIR